MQTNQRFWREQGESNQFYMIEGNDWFASIHINGRFTVPQQHAIMRGFAHVPEMLAALSMCAQRLEELCEQHDTGATYAAQYARELVAKINGDQSQPEEPPPLETPVSKLLWALEALLDKAKAHQDFRHRSGVEIFNAHAIIDEIKREQQTP